MGLYVDFKGERAYFASSRPGGFGGLDIYSFKLAGGMKPDPVTYVQGQVFDAETKAEISGRIEIYNLESSKLYYTDSSGSFFITMQPNGNYSLNIKRQGYLFYSENFQPTASSVDSPFLVKAYLKPIKADEKVVLRNIFFDTDKFDLKPESFTELNQLLELLKKNPGINIEVSGHTDNQGGEDHNLNLSRNRAASVKSYLTGKGIDAKRISTAGYAAKQPIGDNNTPAGRALNRRIEMKITSWNK
jgi:outer membrane protein OmpA-like peptidoglycan-associated protein